MMAMWGRSSQTMSKAPVLFGNFSLEGDVCRRLEPFRE